MPAPVTSVLTSFTGADESPLSEGGIWQSGVTLTGASDAQRLSNQAKAIGTGTGLNMRKPFATSYAADQEAFATIAALPASTQGIGVACRIQGEPSSSTVSFYVGYYHTGTGWRIFSCVPVANFTSIAGTDSTVAAAGDKIWLNCTGTLISLYHFTGGAWNLRVQATNSDVVGAGKIGIEISDDAGILDDFGGGALTVPQILRPDADLDASTWTTAPLWSKLDETPAGGDVVTATAS
jgi:hypothetical protein